VVASLRPQEMSAGCSGITTGESGVPTHNTGLLSPVWPFHPDRSRSVDILPMASMQSRFEGRRQTCTSGRGRLLTARHEE
jgi:hypothetical protein